MFSNKPMRWIVVYHLPGGQALVLTTNDKWVSRYYGVNEGMWQLFDNTVAADLACQRAQMRVDAAGNPRNYKILVEPYGAANTP
jgi:hypothetical protein